MASGYLPHAGYGDSQKTVTLAILSHPCLEETGQHFLLHRVGQRLQLMQDFIRGIHTMLSLLVCSLLTRFLPEGADIRPAVVGSLDGGDGQGGFALVEQQQNPYIAPAVAEEADLQIGGHG